VTVGISAPGTVGIEKMTSEEKPPMSLSWTMLSAIIFWNLKRDGGGHLGEEIKKKGKRGRKITLGLGMGVSKIRLGRNLKRGTHRNDRNLFFHI